MFRRARAIFSASLLALIISLTAIPAHAQVHAADLGALLIALGQMKQNMDGVINTVDAESAQRMRQLEIALDGVIGQINKVIKEGFDKANITEQQLFGNVNDLVANVNGEMDKKGYLAYIGVNSTLVNVCDGV